ncbi:MAG: hypothetical protein AAGI34_19510 [Pseudomonadota bacterium]
MAQDKTLYLHLGHGKTGSSFLQAVFATNRAGLAEAGIAYPKAPDEPPVLPEEGWISSGNGLLLWEEHPEKLGLHETRAALFSREHLMNEVCGDRHDTLRQRVRQLCKTYGFERISMLLLIRDPVDHAISLYHQAVKRGGFTGTLDEYTAGYSEPRFVRKFLERRPFFGSDFKYDYVIRNYSRHRTRLIMLAEAWLGLGEDTLEPRALDTVNRSLTETELEIQRRLNRTLGKSNEMFADLVCTKMPHLKSADLVPSPEAQQQMLGRLKPEIDLVNASIVPGERYAGDIVEGPMQDTQARLGLDGDQVDLLARVLGTEVDHLRAGLLLQRCEARVLAAELLHTRGQPIQQQLDDAKEAARIAANCAALKDQPHLSTWRESLLERVERLGAQGAPPHQSAASA